MVNWDDHKKREKPERSSVLDGIPQNLPALALATKVLGKADKVGLLDADAPGAFSVTNEDELGAILLAVVASAKATGLDSERALRSAVRDLQVEIRHYEIESAGFGDAGVIAEGVADTAEQTGGVQWRDLD
jgi:XTP/dITP diphosphohydrolase